MRKWSLSSARDKSSLRDPVRDKRNAEGGIMKLIIASITLILGVGLNASAQWAKSMDKSVPRTPDGKPNLAAKTPMSREGKPDLSGVWQSDTDPAGLPKGIQTVE